MTTDHLTDLPFADLGLLPQLERGVADAGFTHCTPIQAATLPIALQGRDVAGQAQTGTGKTAAFLLAAMQRLLTHPSAAERRIDQPRALVIAPTRELAIQIHRDAELLGRHAGLVFGLIYGGTGYEEQRLLLERGVDMLIGTPGRLIDYFKQRLFDLKAAEVVVIDEADRMFDLGFIRDMRYLLDHAPSPQQRLSMLFSATLSPRVAELAYERMNDPESIRVEPEQVTVAGVNEAVYFPANTEKIPLLLTLLRDKKPRCSMVFVNTRFEADRVWSWLKGNGFSAAILSGSVPQKKRQALLQRFQEGEISTLVATDVAARGLHIPAVDYVFNYDLPQEAEDYVHRIGRTARAGNSGDAISFACERYAFSLPAIETYIGHRIPVGAAPASAPQRPQPPVKRPERSAPPGGRRAPGVRGGGGRAGGGRAPQRPSGARRGGHRGR